MVPAVEPEPEEPDEPVVLEVGAHWQRFRSRLLGSVMQSWPLQALAAESQRRGWQRSGRMPSSGQKPDAQSVEVRQTAHTERPVVPELDEDAALAAEDDDEVEVELDATALLDAWPGHDDTSKPPDSGTQTRSLQR